MIEPTKSPNTKMVLLSLLMVTFCLGAGGWFVWWYSKGSDDSVITLAPEDMAAMQSAGRRLTYQDNGGVPMSTGRAARPNAPKSPPDPDAIAIAVGGAVQSIRVGMVQVQVQVRPATNPSSAPTTLIVFRQRNWGMLLDPPTFTIARRIKNEDALAKQLMVTPDQMKQLVAIDAMPAVMGKYMTSLPVPAADLDKARQACADYTKQLTAAKGGPAIAALQSDLYKTVGEIGASAMNKAKQDYTDADRAISAILTQQQIDAYRQGKALKP